MSAAERTGFVLSCDVAGCEETWSGTTGDDLASVRKDAIETPAWGHEDGLDFCEEHWTVEDVEAAKKARDAAPQPPAPRGTAGGAQLADGWRESGDEEPACSFDDCNSCRDQHEFVHADGLRSCRGHAGYFGVFVVAPPAPATAGPAVAGETHHACGTVAHRISQGATHFDLMTKVSLETREAWKRWVGRMASEVAALEARLAEQKRDLDKWGVYHEDVEAKLADAEAIAAKAGKKLAELRRQLTLQSANNHQRNLELDALHYVWCDGGCRFGVHRWTDDAVTEELVATAERNTARLRTWLMNKCDRDARAAGRTTEAAQPSAGHVEGGTP